MQPINPHGFDFGDFYEFALCVCADCGAVVPEVELQFPDEEPTLWADCPTCDITGQEFSSHDLPNGRDWDGATFDRHFAQSYTPTVEEIVEVVREEASCEHLDYEDTLTGAKCSTCGLEVSE